MANYQWNPKSQKPEKTDLYLVAKRVPKAKKEWLPDIARYNTLSCAWSVKMTSFDIWAAISYPEDKPGDYRQAIGAAPGFLGNTLPEDAIRKARG